PHVHHGQRGQPAGGGPHQRSDPSNGPSVPAGQWSQLHAPGRHDSDRELQPGRVRRRRWRGGRAHDLRDAVCREELKPVTTAGDRMISEHLARDGERGSALIAAMMLLFVLSILGLALFDTAMIDARLAMTSVDSYRALETAQAGVQLAMYRLYR